MFCTACGSRLEDGAAFCTSCGARVGTEKKKGIKPTTIATILSLVVVLGIATGIAVRLFLVPRNDAGKKSKTTAVISNDGITSYGEDSETHILVPGVTSEERQDISLEIVQIDSSDFPIVRFYVTIQDVNGDTITDLNKDLFEVIELDMRGNLVFAELEEMRELLASDSLSVNLVLDKSGSMDDYGKMGQARNAASYFLQYLEGFSNNFVEMTYFDDTVFAPHPFTDDFSLFLEELYDYPPYGMTALYDALYTALVRTSLQSGAKCVIAFTDGEENASRTTFEEVVDLARATGIPIYMIGVGYDVNETTLMQIADLTGGAYYYSTTAGFERFLQDIYLDVLSMRREQYVVEYRSSLVDALESAYSIVFRPKPESNYSGEAEREYIPVPILPMSIKTLPEVIFDTDDWVRITIYQPDRTDGSAHMPTIFERDKGSDIWTMVSRFGFIRLLDPYFRVDGSTLFIGFPTTTTEYTMLENGGGDFGAQRITWSFETDPDHSIGSVQGDYYVDDLEDALTQYSLISLYMYFKDGDFSILYRDDLGEWRIRMRGVNIIDISPKITHNSEGTTFEFTVSSRKYTYVFNKDGLGRGDGENTLWHCTYYD